MLLDNGIMGIVFPDVNTAAEAKRAVDRAKYPPLGRRSVAGALPIFDFRAVPAPDAVRALNENTLVVCMIETPEGLENVEEIAAVSGVRRDPRRLERPADRDGHARARTAVPSTWRRSTASWPRRRSTARSPAWAATATSRVRSIHSQGRAVPHHQQRHRLRHRGGNAGDGRAAQGARSALSALPWPRRGCVPLPL